MKLNSIYLVDTMLEIISKAIFKISDKFVNEMILDWSKSERIIQCV